MNSSTLLGTFSIFEGNKILQFKLNAEGAAGELLDWGRTRLGVSSGTGAVLCRALPLEFHPSPAAAGPAVGELPQLLLVTPAVISLTIILGSPALSSALRSTLQHLQLLLLGTAWSAPLLPAAPVRTVLLALWGCFFLCSESTATKKLSLHENEASEMKMKQNQL